jgi:hypothetical protein
MLAALTVEFVLLVMLTQQGANIINSKELFSYVKVTLEAAAYTKIMRSTFKCRIDKHNYVAISSYSVDRHCSKCNAI